MSEDRRLDGRAGAFGRVEGTVLLPSRGAAAGGFAVESAAGCAVDVVAGAGDVVAERRWASCSHRQPAPPNVGSSGCGPGLAETARGEDRLPSAPVALICRASTVSTFSDALCDESRVHAADIIVFEAP